MCDDSFDTLDDDVALIVGRIVLMKWKLARPVVTPAIRLANGSPPLEPERLARSYPASRTITIFIGPACLPWAALQATQRADRACSPSTDFIHAARQSARGRNLELDVAAVHARRLGEGTFGDSRRAGAQKSLAATDRVGSAGLAGEEFSSTALTLTAAREDGRGTMQRIENGWRAPHLTGTPAGDFRGINEPMGAPFREGNRPGANIRHLPE